MIKVEIHLNQQEELEHLISQGHALKNNTNEKSEFNGLCTAVSTLEYQLFYSIQTLLPKRKLNLEIKEGFFKLHIKSDIKNEILTTLTKSFIIGIKMLVDRYSEVKLIIN